MSPLLGRCNIQESHKNTGKSILDFQRNDIGGATVALIVQLGVNSTKSETLLCRITVLVPAVRQGQLQFIAGLVVSGSSSICYQQWLIGGGLRLLSELPIVG